MRKLGFPRQIAFRPRLRSLAILAVNSRGRIIAILSVLLPGFPAQALPTGGTVQSGTATISNTTSTKTTVTQTSSSAVINWSSFNTASNETVQFVVPSASSVTVNKAAGTDAWQVFGTLSSNGRLVLINPHGIQFGPNSTVNVESLVATTIGLDTSSLSGGNWSFNSAGDSTASVVNWGTITTASTGVLAMVAPGVANYGVISANLGRVNLGAANSFTLDMTGDRLIQFAVNPQVTAIPLMQTSGGSTAMTSLVTVGKDAQINADGGKVLLTSATVSTILDNAINMDGVIRAQTVGSNRAVVELRAADPTARANGTDTSIVRGTTTVNGSIDASGDTGSERGGTIRVLGEYVNVNRGAVLDVRGQTSGLIKVGGDANLSESGQVTSTVNPIAIGTYVGNSAQLKVNSGDENDVSKLSVNGYVVYLEGDMPVILSSGHDGTLTPNYIADSTGTTVRDTYATDLTKAVASALQADTGHRPHVVINNLARSKMDPNRDPSDSDRYATSEVGKSRGAADIYSTWHRFLTKATNTVQSVHGSGLLVDIHGYAFPGTNNSADPDNDSVGPLIWGFGGLGYNAFNKTAAQFDADPTSTTNNSLRHLIETSGKTASEITYGASSLPTLMQGQGYVGTPSSDHPIPYNTDHGDGSSSIIKHYFAGEYNTDAHGSMNGGSVDALQVETPTYIRDNATNRATFGSAMSQSLRTFMSTNYGHTLSSPNGTYALPTKAATPTAPTGPTSAASGGGASSLTSTTTTSSTTTANQVTGASLRVVEQTAQAGTAATTQTAASAVSLRAEQSVTTSQRQAGQDQGSNAATALRKTDSLSLSERIDPKLARPLMQMSECISQGGENDAVVCRAVSLGGS